MVHDITFNSF